MKSYISQTPTPIIPVHHQILYELFRFFIAMTKGHFLKNSLRTNYFICTNLFYPLTPNFFSPKTFYGIFRLFILIANENMLSTHQLFPFYKPILPLA